MFKVRNVMLVSFYLLRSLRVFKLDEKQLIKLRKNDARLLLIIKNTTLTYY